MAPHRARKAVCVAGALLAALLAEPRPCGAFPSDPTPFLEVDVVSGSSGAFNDPTNGNYFFLAEVFRNSSATETLLIDGLQLRLLNPEDVGFANIEAWNWTQVRGAAEAAHPAFLFGIAAWPGDVPAVDWIFADVQVGGATFRVEPGVRVLLNDPIELPPGASFGMNIMVHNDFFDARFRSVSASRIGELLLGHHFTPEPSTALLLGLGLLGLAGGARRRAR